MRMKIDLERGKFILDAEKCVVISEDSKRKEDGNMPATFQKLLQEWLLYTFRWRFPCCWA